MISMLAVLWMALPAAAQEQMCSGDYPRGTLGTDLDEVQGLFDDANLAGAVAKLDTMYKLLPCSKELIDVELLARYARLVALTNYFQQDESVATKWGLMSRYTYGDLAWPEEMAEEHPFRELVAIAEDPPMNMVDNAGLKIPRGGGIYMNGHLAIEPRGRAEIPYLVQVFDKQEECTDAYWQDGSAFPDWILGEVDLYPELPIWYTGPPPEGYDPDAGRKTRKKVAVVPLAVGGGLAVASAVFYGVASVTASGLSEAKDAQELTSIRTSANTFVALSGLTGAAAVSIGVGSVLTEGRTVGFSVRF